MNVLTEVAGLYRRWTPRAPVEAVFNPQLTGRWRRIAWCKWVLNAHLSAWLGSAVVCMFSPDFPLWSVFAVLGGHGLHFALGSLYDLEHETLRDDTDEYLLSLILVAKSSQPRAVA